MCVCMCVCAVKILSPDIQGLSGRACLHAPSMSCRLLPSPPLFSICICIYRMHRAIGLFSNTVAVQICLRVGGVAGRDGGVGQRNLCKHLPGFLTDFWLFSHSSVPHFPIPYHVLCIFFAAVSSASSSSSSFAV